MCARIRHADMLDETKSRDDDPLKASRTRAADTCDDAAGGIRLVARRQIRPSGRLRRALVNSQHRPFSSSTLARPPFSTSIPSYSYAPKGKIGCPTRRLDRPPFGIARRPDGRQQDSMDRIDREDGNSSVHID